MVAQRRGRTDGLTDRRHYHANSPSCAVRSANKNRRLLRRMAYNLPDSAVYNSNGEREPHSSGVTSRLTKLRTSTRLSSKKHESVLLGRQQRIGLDRSDCVLERGQYCWSLDSRVAMLLGLCCTSNLLLEYSTNTLASTRVLA